MTKEEFAKGIKTLCYAYNQDMTKNQVEVWYEFFYNTDYQIFKQAIKRIIPTNKYFPSIAELKEEIVKYTTKELQLNAEEEWQNVLNAIRNYDIYDGEKAIESLKPYTAKIVKMIGWFKLCISENIIWEKKEFIKLFNEEQMSLKEYQQKGEILTDTELSYKEQILLEEQEIDKQNLLELQN